MITKTPNLSHVKYILVYINQYPPIKNTKGSLGHPDPYSIKWGGNIAVILHIYGARAISLLFCVHQDFESDSCEICISIYQPIFTQESRKGSMGQWYPDSTIWVKNIVAFFLFMELEPFFNYFVFTKTSNLSRVK